MGCINSGPEEVLQKISDCHVILIGLHCGLGSPARALSSVMTKDGKAANNPVLVMPAAAGSRQGRPARHWRSSGLRLEHGTKSQNIGHHSRPFSYSPSVRTV